MNKIDYLVVPAVHGLLAESLADSWSGGSFSLEPIHPDGSQRRFYRVVPDGIPSLVAVLPPEQSATGMAEASSAWKIGCHLRKRGVPVPEMIGFDDKTGLMLCEDLGDLRLHDLAAGDEKPDHDRLAALYRKVIVELIDMQVNGAEGFDPEWCWDSPRYDRSLMLERESGYFLRSFCQDYLQLADLDLVGLDREFRELAESASSAPSHFFLHRDFQSRNIMIKDAKVRFVDYQGGRFGPLGYDLASLLIDPYVSLSQSLQDELYSYYLSGVRDRIEGGEELFRIQYLALALQRNLQALGAFGFLFGSRGKQFFASAIRPGLSSLQSLLAKPELAGYRVLGSLAGQCSEQAACQAKST